MPSSCADIFSNAVGIPAIRANARIEEITVEYIFEFILFLVKYDIYCLKNEQPQNSQ